MRGIKKNNKWRLHSISKLILIGLGVAFIVTGCKKGRDNYGFQIPINNFTWGMTIDQVNNLVQLSDLEEDRTERQEGFVLKQIKDTKTIFGFDGTVILSFTDLSDYGLGESSVLEKLSITYDNIDTSKLKSNMDKKLKVTGTSNVDENGYTNTNWLSKDIIGDIKDEEIKKMLSDYWYTLYQDELTSEQIDKLFSDTEHVNFISLVEEDTKATVNYYGGKALIINLLKSK